MSQPPAPAPDDHGPLRVLYFTGYFPPDPIAKRAAGIAGALAERGHGVTVLTRWPSGPGGPPLSAPEVEEADATLPETVSVVRFGSPDRRADARVLGRILGQLLFALRCFLKGLSLARRHDVVLAYTPPPFLGAAARWVARLSGRPLVLEVQDLYPAQAVALEILDEGLLHRLAKAVEGDMYRAAARLIVVTDGYREHVTERGADPRRTVVIPNSCDPGRFHPGVEPLDDGVEPRRVNALFAGTVGLAQGTEVILDAAARLADREWLGFEIHGGGALRDHFRRRAREEGLENVRFADGVPYERMPSVMARGDILLLTLHPHPVFGRVVPSKLSEYLAMGRPVVAAARGSVARILEEAGAGLAVEPLDGEGLARAVLRLGEDPELRAEMGRRARELAQRRFADGPVLEACADAVEAVA